MFHITSQKVVRLHSVKLNHFGLIYNHKILPFTVQKSLAFLYTNNNQKKILRKSHLNKTSSNKLNHEHKKPVVRKLEGTDKETKENTNTQKIIPRSCTGTMRN